MIAAKNALANETSPYLLMHAKNPVYWYPWIKEALEKAKIENKLIIISIGYAACHWCHVMEKESFSSDEVAAYMNEHFVSIKIDREERPDLDQVFMDVAHLTTGRGGWPLNIIALPNGQPFFAGTYFQKRQWMNLLREVNHLFVKDQLRLEDLALQIKAGIERMDFVGLVKDSVLFTSDVMDETISNWKQNLDLEWGGNIGAPKFPMPVEYHFLLSYLQKNTDSEILEYVNLSLSRMAWGGIYDHLGGGFARYSVDAKWKVPHFEKMLYDQGQLIEVYSIAYQITGNPLFKSVVDDTIAFVKTELSSEKGGFYSSLDADSEGKEGKYYVWTKQEIDHVLRDDSRVFCKLYNITEEGNWEQGKNVIYQTLPLDEVAHELGIETSELRKQIKKSKSLLYHEQKKRVKPALDDKILTSWNAIIIKGLVVAYKATGNENYLNDAIITSEFIKNKAFQKDGGLWRILKGEKGTINAFLDDYALLIDAWIELYMASFDEQWMILAHDLCEYALAHFFNDDNQLFYYTSVKDDPLLVRKSEIADNVIPASNSIMAINLYRLSKFYLNKESYTTSLQMLKNISGRIDQHGKYYANWQRLKLFFIYESHELVLSGDGQNEAHKELLKEYNPYILLASGCHHFPISENKASEHLVFHLCKNNCCHLPINSIEEVKEKIKEI